jgi:dTDP-4-dehydrorhamnose reductase
MTNVDWCESHPAEAQRVNVDASAALADIAADLGVRLVYVSTDAVFDGRIGNYTEEDEALPVNVYGKSKLRGEQAVLSRCQSSVVVRATIYGWNAQPKQSLAEWVICKLESGKPVPGFTDVRFAPLLVNDLAEMLLILLGGTRTGIYHAGSVDGLSKYDFAQTIASVFEFDRAQILPSRLEDAALPAARPLNTTLNSKKLESVLGRAMPTVIQGVGRLRQLRDNGYVQRLKIYATRSSK